MVQNAHLVPERVKFRRNLEDLDFNWIITVSNWRLGDGLFQLENLSSRW